jgi:hypothetical protein
MVRKYILNLNESLIYLENEIIEEKLSLGINGLEWLVMQVEVDDSRISSLNSFMRICSIFRKEFLEILKPALILDHETFYKKHELNWWIAVDESLTYLALMKQNHYNEYFQLLNNIYTKSSEGGKKSESDHH